MFVMHWRLAVVKILLIYDDQGGFYLDVYDFPYKRLTAIICDRSCDTDVYNISV